VSKSNEVTSFYSVIDPFKFDVVTDAVISYERKISIFNQIILEKVNIQH
jgi:hypothetical protein